MAFLEINGWTISVADGGAQDYPELGSLDNAFSGRLNKHRLGNVREWSFETCFYNESDADTLEALLEGRGHYFPFDHDAWSHAGIGPLPSGGYSIREVPAGSPTPFAGIGCLELSTSVYWNLRLPTDKWTVLLRRWSGSAWDHYALLADGTHYVNGALQLGDHSYSWFASGDGQIGLVGAGEYFDELVVMPVLCSFGLINAHFFAGTFSPLPELRASGDFSGGEAVTVLARVDDEPYFQTGGAAWSNNDRRLLFTLTEKKVQKESLIEGADAFWLMNSDYIAPGGELRPAHGQYDATIVGATAGQTGPFGFGEAFLFGGTDRLDLPLDVARNLGGFRQFTVLAWAKQDSVGAQRTITQLSIAGSSAKIGLSLLSGNTLRCGGRSDAADSFQSAVSAGTYTDTDEFHLYGGIINLTDSSISLIYDGEIIETETGKTFTGSVFTNEVGSECRVGLDVAGANPWPGDVAVVGYWCCGLSSAEIKRVYELGRRGIFR